MTIWMKKEERTSRKGDEPAEEKNEEGVHYLL
jgi:hypothetical protein